MNLARWSFLSYQLSTSQRLESSRFSNCRARTDRDPHAARLLTRWHLRIAKDGMFRSLVRFYSLLNALMQILSLHLHSYVMDPNQEI